MCATLWNCHIFSHLWPLATLARFVYAFDDEIREAIESAISTAIISGAGKLDTFLLELPRILPIDDTSAIDVTVVDDPFVGPTFLSVAAKGEFVSLKKSTVPPQPDHSLSPGIFCKDSAKMVTIALCDYVINSAAEVYYEVHSSILGTDNVFTFGFLLSPLPFSPWGSHWPFSGIIFGLPVLLHASFQSLLSVILLHPLHSWGCPESFQIGIGHTIPWEELKVKAVFKTPLNVKKFLFFSTLFFFLVFDFAVLAFGRQGPWIGLWTSCPNSHY